METLGSLHIDLTGSSNAYVLLGVQNRGAEKQDREDQHYANDPWQLFRIRKKHLGWIFYVPLAAL